ncbi:MAG TPA: hypothetical protein VH228_16485 [Nocardioides sp.]|nr:hypothetical protein [Nocardioides sp.]
MFLPTAHWWTGQVSDAVGASWPAWQLAHHGTLDLAGRTLPANVNFLHQPGGMVVAQRTMGVILIAVPVNFLLAWTHWGPEQTGAVTASLTSAIAVANIAVVFRAFTNPRRAVMGALVLAFGTGMWTVASAELWTHGPATMWLSLGLLLLTRDRLLLAGCALSPALLTRPHLAVVSAIVGIWIGLARRSPRATLAIGAPSVLTLGLLVRWNDWYFGTASVGGPYHGAIAAAVRPPTDAAVMFLTNVAGTVVSGWCGIVWYSPVVLVLAAAVPVGWRQAPDWARASLVAGLVYLAIQLRVDTFTGGGTFYGNRLVLELFVLATPVVMIGYERWAAERPWRTAAVTVAASLSIGIYAVGALLPGYRVGGAFSNWTVWYPALVVRAAGSLGALVVAGVTLCVAFSVREAISRARAQNRPPPPTPVPPLVRSTSSA